MDAARWVAAGEPITGLRLGGRRGLAAILIIALLAAWTSHYAVEFLALALLATAGVARIWADHALAHVSCRHELAEQRAFPGESLDVRLVAENCKLLPLAWIRARSAVPVGLTPVNLPPRWPYVERGGYLHGVAALGWHMRAVWQFRLHCRGRGVYHLGPVELVSGDPFGLFARRTVFAHRPEVVVYPRIVPIGRLGFPLAAGVGAARRLRALQEDPSRVAGVRAYRPGDPLRRIHWKATARQGELQVRTLESAVSPLLMLVLAADTFDFAWTRYREDLFELAASALASVAWRALEDGWQVGLRANAPTAVSLPLSSAAGQLTLILEALARVEPRAGTPISASLADPLDFGRDATYVFAIGRSTPPLLETLERLLASRRPAVVLYGDEPPRVSTALPSYRLSQWEELATTLEHGAAVVTGGR